MTELVAELPVNAAEHVFALRHGARVAAAAVGADEADQVRFATALSELGREALAHGGGASASFRIAEDGSLVVDVDRFPRSALLAKPMSGVDAARKLVGDVAVVDRDEETVTVTLRRPASPRRPIARPAELRAVLAARAVPLEDLRVENRELISTLEALKLRQEELTVLNAELQETNRGVMAMYDIERVTALSLQHNLLPDEVTEIPGIDVAVRYLASAENAEVGGDFYEVFALSDDRIAFAIGDVAGHSLEAAMVMAQLRTGIRCYLLEGHGPEGTLDRLNRLLLQFHHDWTATVCCGVYERSSGTCEVANAGHLSPVVIGPDGARFLPFGGPLLGIDARGVSAHTFAFSRDQVLLMYTDGLIERRYESLEIGLDRLARVVALPAASLAALCDRVLLEAGPESILDDIAIVAIRPTA